AHQSDSLPVLVGRAERAAGAAAHHHHPRRVQQRDGDGELSQRTTAQRAWRIGGAADGGRGGRVDRQLVIDRYVAAVAGFCAASLSRRAVLSRFTPVYVTTTITSHITVFRFISLTIHAAMNTAGSPASIIGRIA